MIPLFTLDRFAMDTTEDSNHVVVELEVQHDESVALSAHTQPDDVGEGVHEECGESSFVSSQSLPTQAPEDNVPVNSKARADKMTFQTIIHILLSKESQGPVHMFVKDQIPEESNMLRCTLEMERGCNKQHWMTPPFQVSGGEIGVEVAVPSDEGGILSKVKSMFTTGSHKVVCTRILKLQKSPHNFVFPTRDDPKVGLSRAKQLGIFLQYMAVSSTSQAMLQKSLSGFKALSDKIDLQPSSPGKISTKPENLFAEVQSIILDLKSLQRNAGGLFSILFMAIASCHFIQTITDYPLQRAQALKDKKVPCTILSCFNTFSFLSSEAIEDLPQWALTAVRGRSHRAVEYLVKESSLCPFNWIHQIPGLLAVCKSFHFLSNVLQPNWMNYSGQRMRSVPRSTNLFKPKVRVVNISKADEHYLIAVESVISNDRIYSIFQNGPTGIKGKDEVVRMITQLVIFEAPNISSLFLLLSAEKFRPMQHQCWGLQEAIELKINDLFDGDHVNVVQELGKIWNANREFFVLEQSTQTHSFSGVGSTVTITEESNCTATILALQNILVSKVDMVHGWPNQSQSVFVSLVKDTKIFPGGLLTVANRIRKLNVWQKMSGWATLLLRSRIFIDMLPDAVMADLNDKGIDQLIELCKMWVKDRVEKDQGICALVQVVDELLENVPVLSTQNNVANCIRDDLMLACRNHARKFPLVQVSQWGKHASNETLLDCIEKLMAEKIDREVWYTRIVSTRVHWKRARDVLHAVWGHKGVLRIPTSMRTAQTLWNMTNKVINAVTKVLPSTTSFNRSSINDILQDIQYDGVVFWQSVIDIYQMLEECQWVQIHIHSYLEKLASGTLETVQAIELGNLTFQEAEDLLCNTNDFNGICSLFALVANKIDAFVHDPPAFEQASLGLSQLGQWLEDLKNELHCIEAFVGVFCERLQARKVLQVCCHPDQNISFKVVTCEEIN